MAVQIAEMQVVAAREQERYLDARQELYLEARNQIATLLKAEGKNAPVLRARAMLNQYIRRQGDVDKRCTVMATP